MRLLLLSLLAALVAGMRYDGFRVVEFTPETDGEVAALESLFQDQEIIPFDYTRKVRKDRRQEMLVPPSRQDVYDSLQAAHIDFTIINDDYQHHVDEIWERVNNRKAYDEDDFNTLDDIYDRLYELEADCPPQWECNVQTMTLTEEGRPILSFMIAPQNAEAYIIVDGGSHAREWASVTSVMKLLEYIHSGQEPDLMAQWGWVIIPVFNPDGYDYTFTNDRNWRKNRRESPGQCFGVDLNRNFDWEWGEEGGSHEPCSDIYVGPSVASEREVSAMQAYLRNLYLNTELKAFINAHTYGPAWVHPYGTAVSGQCRFAPNHGFLYNASQEMAEASAAVDSDNYNLWEYGNSCVVFYPVSGSSIDYVMGQSDGDVIAYTGELRGTSFIIPVAEIPVAFEEFLAGMKALHDYMQRHPEIK